MSRIRTTLDSVTKAVGSSDLISKFSRLKPGKVDSTNGEKVLVKAETLISNNTEVSPPPETTMKAEDGEKNTVEEEDDKHRAQVAEKPFVATKKSTSTLASEATVSAPISPSTVAKQTIQLFHPSGLSTNMDETYKTLAQHINSYFGTSTQWDEDDNRPQQHRRGPVSESILRTAPRKAEDHIPVLSPVAESKSIDAPAISPSPPPTCPSEMPSHPEVKPSSAAPVTESAAQSVPAPASSPKKGFTRYLSYPRPSVQAFVGSYIAPLVPKFRVDSKSITAEKEKIPVATVEEPVVDKAAEKKESEEEKADEAKQQLIAQREKVDNPISS